MKNGFLDPIFAVIQDHPSVAAGTITFAVAFSLVAGNAFYAQSGTHPEPIWATRDATFTHSVDRSLKTVSTSVVKPRSTEIPVPVSREQAKPKPSPLVADVQKALIATGDFKGEVDGLMGPVTAAAIKAYQKRHNFEETGEASRLLLSSIEQNIPVATKSGGSLTGLITRSENAGADRDFDRELVRKIQQGLANQGIEIEADGIFGSKTKAAIANWQRSKNVDVTGIPDRAVLDLLKKHGALDS